MEEKNQNKTKQNQSSHLWKANIFQAIEILNTEKDKMALLPCIYQLIQTRRAISSPGVTTLREKNNAKSENIQMVRMVTNLERDLDEEGLKVLRFCRLERGKQYLIRIRQYLNG